MTHTDLLSRLTALQLSASDALANHSLCRPIGRSLGNGQLGALATATAARFHKFGSGGHNSGIVAPPTSLR